MAKQILDARGRAWQSNMLDGEDAIGKVTMWRHTPKIPLTYINMDIMMISIVLKTGSKTFVEGFFGTQRGPGQIQNNLNMHIALKKSTEIDSNLQQENLQQNVFLLKVFSRKDFQSVSLPSLGWKPCKISKKDPQEVRSSGEM